MISSQKKIWNVLIPVFVMSLIYAILRYNIFSDVPWTDLPMYVLNKAVSLVIIVLIFYDQNNKISKTKPINNMWFIILIVTILHIILSVVLLAANYFEKFYYANQLNFVGSLSLLFGILAFLVFLIQGVLWMQKNISKTLTIRLPYSAKLKCISLSFIGLHLFVMGINGWLTPHKWPGYMPPISLIAFVLLISAIFIIITRK